MCIHMGIILYNNVYINIIQHAAVSSWNRPLSEDIPWITMGVQAHHPRTISDAISAGYDIL